MSEENQETAQPGQATRETTIATEYHLRWLYVCKSIDANTREEAAELYNADNSRLRAQRIVIDTQHPLWREMTSLKNASRKFWIDNSKPYVERGVRLTPHRSIAPLLDGIREFNTQMQLVSDRMEPEWQGMREEARRKLGRLWRPGDLPESPVGAFGVSLSDRVLTPVSFLMYLHPQEYAQRTRELDRQFAQVARIAEASFVEDFGEVISHLAERLAHGPDVRPTIFRDSAVENVREFFQSFRTLNVESSAQLEALVARAESLLNGVSPDDLRTMNDLRQTVRTQAEEISAQLQAMTVNAPTRRIRRLTE